MSVLMSSVIAGGAAIGGAVLGGISNRNTAKRNAASNLDIAETPTRISGIDQLLNDLASTAEQSQSTSLDEFVNTQQEMNSNQTESSESENKQNSINNVLETQQQQQDINTAITQRQNELASTQGSTSNDQTTDTAATTQGTADSTTQRGNAESQQALSQLIGQLGGGGADASAAVSALMSQILREGQGGINDTVANSGTFDSTTEALLKNNLNVKAAEAGAGLQLQEQARNQELLLQAITAGQSGTEATTQQTSEQQQVQEALAAITSNQQLTSTGTTSTESQQQSVDGSTSNQSSAVGSVSDIGSVIAQTAIDQNTSTQQDTQGTEQIDGTTTSTETQNQQNISDQFQNPGDAVKVPTMGALGQLLATGGVNAGTPEGQGALVNAEGQGGTPAVPNPITGVDDNFLNQLMQMTARQTTASDPLAGAQAIDRPTPILFTR
jgi:hypothetical protein